MLSLLYSLRSTRTLPRYVRRGGARMVSDKDLPVDMALDRGPREVDFVPRSMRGELMMP